MATNDQALDQTTSPPDEVGLDEDSLISSLARLQELHISLRGLRETIPKVMHSVLLDPLSPDQLHSNFSQAANGAAQAIKHFTQLVEDSRTKEVMENAQESRRQNSEGIVGWQVTEHEDWLDAKQGDGNDSVGKEEGVVAEAGDSASMGNVNVALDKFRSTHVGLEVSLDEGSRTVNLNLPPPAQINFQIELPNTSEGQDNFGIDTKGKSSFHEAILEAIRQRTKTNDLTYLLEMLASYVDIKSRLCVNCSRLLDRNAQFPIIRSKKKSKHPDSQSASQWQALHTACT